MAAASVQATSAYRLVRSGFSSCQADLAVYQRGQKKKVDVDEFKHHRETVLKILGSLFFCVESDAYSIILF